MNLTTPIELREFRETLIGIEQEELALITARPREHAPMDLSGDDLAAINEPGFYPYWLGLDDYPEVEV